MSVIERLQSVIKGHSLSEVARLLDEKEHRVKSVVYGKQRIPEDFLIKVLEVFGVDANWLLLGVGEQPKPELTPREAALLDNYRHSPEEGKRSAEESVALFAKLGPGDKTGKKAG